VDWQWFERTVDRLSPQPPPRRWWQIWPFWKKPRSVTELGLERGGEVTFEAVRQRVCDAYQADMRPDDRDYELDRSILDGLRKAESFEEIGEITGASDLIGFLG
jgi:hypothetical protein